jgi:hypothetical protein
MADADEILLEALLDDVLDETIIEEAITVIQGVAAVDRTAAIEAEPIFPLGWRPQRVA